MKRVLLFLVLGSWCVATLWAATLTGKVVGVSDGDTITVLDANKMTHKIRLAGIDAPEKSQPLGDRSKQHLGSLVFGKTVEVEWHKADKYGRTVGKVLVAGHDANLDQVKSGFAWHYKAYANEQSPNDRTLYAQAEMSARGKRIGLWSDPAPIPPWEFRHPSAEKSPPADSASSSSKCPCGKPMLCTGPRGGRFCTTPSGKKRYL